MVLLFNKTLVQAMKWIEFQGLSVLKILNVRKTPSPRVSRNRNPVAGVAHHIRILLLSSGFEASFSGKKTQSTRI